MNEKKNEITLFMPIIEGDQVIKLKINNQKCILKNPISVIEFSKEILPCLIKIDKYIDLNNITALPENIKNSKDWDYEIFVKYWLNLSHIQQEILRIILDKKQVLRDELINGNQASRIKWNMLTQKNIQIIDSKKAIIRKDGKALIFRIIRPDGVSIKTYSSEPDNNFEDKNPNTQMIGFETELQPNQEDTFLVVLIPGETDNLKNFMNKPLNDW